MARALVAPSACKLICQSKLIHISSLSFVTTSYKSAGPKNVAPAAAGTSGNPLGRKRFRRPPKSTEAEYLVSHVSGSCYFNEGEDIKIKDDSQYPDWLWNMHLGKPKTTQELEFGTKEYWETLKLENMIKFKRTLSKMPTPNRIVAPNLLEELEWKKRVRLRALASDDVDPGLNPDDYRQRPDRKMFLRPNKVLEEEDLTPDEFLAKNPEKFVKYTRKDDYFEHVAPKTRCQSRKSSGSFPEPSILRVHPESAISKLPDQQELTKKRTPRQLVAESSES